MLDAAIDQHHALAILGAVLAHLGTRCLGDEIVHIGVVALRLGLALKDDFAQHRAALAQVLGEGTGINAVQTCHLLLAQPVAKSAVGQPVGVLPGIVLGDDGAAVYARALEILAQVGAASLRGHAVIAEQRKGGDENLPLIGRVGKAFGIAGHGGVEHYLSGCRCLVAKRIAFKTGAILKYQDGWCGLSHAIVTLRRVLCLLC